LAPPQALPQPTGRTMPKRSVCSLNSRAPLRVHRSRSDADDLASRRAMASTAPAGHNLPRKCLQGFGEAWAMGLAILVLGLVVFLGAHVFVTLRAARTAV